MSIGDAGQGKARARRAPEAYFLLPTTVVDAGVVDALVESGHKVARKKLGEPSSCADVHYPTDVSVAMRCVLRETGEAAGQHAVGGWRRGGIYPEGQEAGAQGTRALVARTAETRRGVEETSINRRLDRSCPAPNRRLNRRDDALDLPGAHALDFEGQGGHAGGTGSAGRSHRGPINSSCPERTWTWRRRWSGRRGIPICGRAASTGVSQS